MNHVLKLYASYDRKAEYFHPPFTAGTDVDAIRAFTSAVVSSETPLSFHPADFDLIKVAEMDMVTGMVSPLALPAMIINGYSALQASRAERSRYQKLNIDPDGTVTSVEPPVAS